MKIKKFGIYLTDLNPKFGTEPGKVRPVVIIQTDLLNNYHKSTIICPITTKMISHADILRVHLNKKENGLDKDSDILIDQIRSIDNRRFIKYIGRLTDLQKLQLLENLKIVVLE